MENQSRIYWFSGTGNSLHAAKRLSVELGNMQLVRITNETPGGAVGSEGSMVGFVFPSYYGNLPRAVRALVESLEIKPGTYTFAVVTMGAVGQGSVASLDKGLKAKGLRLDCGRGIRMPADYVLKYNPADPDKAGKLLDKVEGRLRAFAAEIEARKQSVKTLPISANNLYKDIEKLDAAFIAGDGCTGCGLCEKVCPVSNIRLEKGNPTWLHHCEHCVACISWCPAQAIQYGNLTQERRRYCNPRINADELTRHE